MESSTVKRQPLIRKPVIAVAIAVTSVLLATLLYEIPFFKTMEWKTYDLRFRLLTDSSQASPEIVMVNIDDFSLEKMAENDLGRFPWPRDIYAVVLDYLDRAKPRAVAFDLLFLEEDNRSGLDNSSSGDQQLAEATRRIGNVIHSAEVNDTHEYSPPSPPAAAFLLDHSVEGHRSVKLPFPALAAASRMLGHTLLPLDTDGPLRRAVPFVRQQDHYYPSLAIATVMVALDLRPSEVRLDDAGLHLGSRLVPLTKVQPEYVEKIETRHLLLNYKGSAFIDQDRITRTYRSYSFWDLFVSEGQLREGVKPEKEPALFRDKIVFIGTTAAGLHDLWQTPFGSQGKMPGMQIHVTVVDNILNDSFMRPAGWLPSGALLMASTLLVGLTGVYLGFWWSLAAVVGIACADAGVAAWLFRQGVWIPSVPAVIGLLGAEFSAVAYKYFVEDRAKREVKGLFSRYVSPVVVKELLEDPSKARLGGERREMTVLFSDIRGFTTLSEAGRPEDVIHQLNEYFTRMVELLFEHRGTLDKFVGDMIMALFNAPVEDPEHPDQAVKMALAMLRELKVLNERWSREGRPNFDIGVGINTGEMIVGNVGSEKTLSYTVIGDNVNLGSRLESLNKEYGSHIIISDATYKGLKGNYFIRPLGEVKVKGKTRAVPIYEVCTSEEAMSRERQRAGS